MGRLEKRGRKKDAQLRGRDQPITVYIPQKKRGETEGEPSVAMLPLMVSTRDRMERKIPHVLQRPAPEGSIWRPNERKRQRGLAKIRSRKAISLKRGI